MFFEVPDGYRVDSSAFYDIQKSTGYILTQLLGIEENSAKETLSPVSANQR